MKEPKTVILVLNHVLHKEVLNHLNKVKTDCSGDFRIVFLCDNTKGLFDHCADDNNYFLFTLDQISEMGYPAKSSLVRSDESRRKNPHHKYFNFPPGCVDLPLHFYFRQNPDYDYYWLVENDARYTGSWHKFFSYFEDNEADLLGTTLTRYEAVPDWYYWPFLDFRDIPIEKENYVRGFFPVCRLSNHALKQIDRDYRNGVKGSYEALVPTLLLHAGMSVEDFGGDGEFVRPQNINRFYRNTPSTGSLSPGTFVFRPIMDRSGKEPDTLWHPVKYSPAWKIALRRAKRLLWGAVRRLAGKP